MFRVSEFGTGRRPVFRVTCFRFSAPAADSQGPIPPRLKSTPKASLPPLYLLYCTKRSDCIRRARFASASASCLHYVSALATRGGARTPRPRRRQWRRDVPRKRRPRPQPLRPRPHLTRSRRRHHPRCRSLGLCNNGLRQGKAHQCTRLRQALGSTAARGRESVRGRERRASGHFGTKTAVFGVSCFTFRWVAVFRVSLFGRQRCFVFHFSPHACVSRVSCFSWTGGETPSGAKTCSLPAAVCCRSRPLVQLASPTNPRVRPHAAHHILTTPARPWPTVRVPQSGRILSNDEPVVLDLSASGRRWAHSTGSAPTTGLATASKRHRRAR